MFRSMKMEKYMEFELTVNFQVKLVTKNIVPGFPGTQNRAVSAERCLFQKKTTNVLNQTVAP